MGGVCSGSKQQATATTTQSALNAGVMLRTPRLYKLIMLGDSGVGKTAICRRYAQGLFSKQYKATIGADFFQKQITLRDEFVITVQVWDTAGQERFQSLGPAFYRGADACILVFDVSAPHTVRNLAHWVSDFMSQMHSEVPPMFLIANKCDLASPELTPDLIAFLDEYKGFFAARTQEFKSGLMGDHTVVPVSALDTAHHLPSVAQAVDWRTLFIEQHKLLSRTMLNVSACTDSGVNEAFDEIGNALHLRDLARCRRF
eukprot:TRINITY_DN4644_c0_g1_i1.p2 TRINITY_DN4644_c0_g1~~TRINITY_DN4644_c0_g1_i1.p2  ORF type:complete len:258 (+),score=48.43 TRINITY_DN4644_c0_g1_i1:38-811(+)